MKQLKKPADLLDADSKPSEINRVQTVDLIKNVSRVCSELGVAEPGEYLARVMAGEDPRPGVGALLELVEEIGETAPSQDDWAKLYNLVTEDPAYRRDPLPAVIAIKAAEKLIEYLHPKLKAVDVTARIACAIAPAPLNAEEAQLFSDWFNNEF